MYILRFSFLKGGFFEQGGPGGGTPVWNRWVCWLTNISVNSQCNWQRSLQLFLAKQQSFMPLTHCLELQGAGEIYSENNLLLESNECRDREKLEPHEDFACLFKGLNSNFPNHNNIPPQSATDVGFRSLQPTPAGAFVPNISYYIFAMTSIGIHLKASFFKRTCLKLTLKLLQDFD